MEKKQLLYVAGLLLGAFAILTMAAGAVFAIAAVFKGVELPQEAWAHLEAVKSVARVWYK